MNRLGRLVARGNIRLTPATSLFTKSFSCRPLVLSATRPSSLPFRCNNNNKARYFLSSSRPLLSSTTNIDNNNNNNNNGDEITQQSDGNGMLFGKWPWYPLIGLGVITGISKELLILNDELVYVSMFFAFTTGVYIYLGQDVKNYFQSQIQKQREAMLECTGIARDTVVRFITIEKRNMSFPDDVKSLFEEEQKMSALSVDYQNKKHKIDVSEAVLQKLSTVKALEEEEANEYKKAVLSYATDYVRDKYHHLSPQEKSNHIDHLIDQLPTMDGYRPVEDVIVASFEEFMANEYSPRQLGVPSRVPTFLSKEREEAKKQH
jgi:hypothetical protein